SVWAGSVRRRGTAGRWTGIRSRNIRRNRTTDFTELIASGIHKVNDTVGQLIFVAAGRRLALKRIERGEDAQARRIVACAQVHQPVAVGLLAGEPKGVPRLP